MGSPGWVEVSVVIPAFNAVATLGDALESISIQDGVAWEALVVDDGSSDGTGALAREWSVRDSRIRVLTHRDAINRGVAASRNLGVRVARGEVVAFLDADDLLLPGALEKSVGALKRFPEAVVAYGRGERVSWTGETEVIGRGLPGVPACLFKQLCCFNVVITSAVATRRTALGVEPFPSGLPFQFEDWACWLELARKGAFVFVPQVLCRYRQSPLSALAVIEAAGALPRFEAAQAAFLRSVALASGAAVRRTIRQGLVYRAAESLRCSFPALRHGRWNEARSWLHAWLQIARSPFLAMWAISSAVAAHRRAVAGVDPSLRIEPWTGLASTDGIMRC